jgi:CRP-like cAMP-binding protein
MSNHLLSSLSLEEWGHWQPHLEPMEMSQGGILCEPGRQLSHLYFPTTATVSLTQLTDNGVASEFAVVGNDGAVSIALFLGGNTTPSQAIVITPGRGFRVPAGVVLDRFALCAEVRHLMLRYTQALLTQLAQTALCNRHHSIDQQLCRWLLMRLDRIPGNEIPITQQRIANLLGVRRESVTEAAHMLQQAGWIVAARGRTTVIDRRGLETRTCECYRMLQRETERLVPPRRRDRQPSAAAPTRFANPRGRIN